MDKLINQTHTSNSLSVFQQYATYTAAAAAVHLDAERLHGRGDQQQAGERGLTTRSRTLLPEYWNFTK